MTLQEKIQKAKTCESFHPFRDGNCLRNGYAPFDCEYCTSYKEYKEVQIIDTKQSIGGLMVKRMIEQVEKELSE